MSAGGARLPLRRSSPTRGRPVHGGKFDVRSWFLHALPAALGAALALAAAGGPAGPAWADVPHKPAATSPSPWTAKDAQRYWTRDRLLAATPLDQHKTRPTEAPRTGSEKFDGLPVVGTFFWHDTLLR